MKTLTFVCLCVYCFVASADPYAWLCSATCSDPPGLINSSGETPVVALDKLVAQCQGTLLAPESSKAATFVNSCIRND